MTTSETAEANSFSARDHRGDHASRHHSVGAEHQAARTQRQLLIAGGGAYGAVALAAGLRDLADRSSAAASFAALAAVLICVVLSFSGTARTRNYAIPLIIACVFAAHIVVAVARTPEDGAFRFALLFGLLGLYLSLLTATRRAGLTALTVMAILALAGAFAVLRPRGLSLYTAMLYWVPLLAATVMTVFRRAEAERAADTLRAELERRATSDELTGVSNRAHIQLLAQNEFARARRYREAFACLMLEIDNYAALAGMSRAAAAAVIQVFAGYCVVVMRHCDSFGRLGPARFLALLPETAGAGALTLANRMCRDATELAVAAGAERLNFTVSIGAAEIGGDDRVAGDVLRRAEQALEDAIEQGRSRAVLGAVPAEITTETGANTAPVAGSAL